MVGTFAKAVTSLLNNTSVHNADTLLRLVRSRPSGVPLITLHTFPEGKVNQEITPVRRLKWGTASLIVRSPVTPIVLPIVHRGFQEVSSPNCFYISIMTYTLKIRCIHVVSLFLMVCVYAYS
ncbi:N-acylphosphatidylethanolamine synthase [Linum perenne]